MEMEQRRAEDNRRRLEVVVRIQQEEAGANAEDGMPILEEAVPDAYDEAWSCSACTFFNAKPLYLVCDMCNNPRPPPNQVSVM